MEMEKIGGFSALLPWPVLIAALLVTAGCGSGSTPLQGPSIVTTSLPDGTIGSSYSQTIQATGGVAPFTWSVTSGALPHGITLPGSTGNSVAISGTPDRVQPGVAFSIQVADANGRSGKQSYTVNIQSTPTIAVTQSGAVQGVVDGNFLRFRGIPFAAPPLGNLRWKPPVAPASWDGIRSAANFGNRCPQTDFAGGVQGDEDCLTLNVYSTYPPASTKQPVTVFFHGGGNVLGSAQDPPWDVTPPLAGHGVIVVTAQYRLGILGDLAIQELTTEGNGSSGNYCLRDMIAALQWVHDNIAQFNGDPNHVMMFGQSAGSINVQALLASPKVQGQGLITSAGMESSVLPAGLLGTSVADAYTFYAGFVPAVGCSPPQDVLACLRNLPLNTIMQRQFVQFPSFMGYNLDPDILPTDPFEKLKLGSPVPLLIGSNRDEAADLEDPSLPMDASQYAMAIHTQFDPLLPGTGTQTGDKIISLYPAAPVPFDTNPRYTHIDVETDYSITRPTRDLARAVAAVVGPQKQPVWLYLFTHQYETDPHLTIRRAFHTAELYFVAGLVPGNTRSVYYDGTQYTPNAAEGTLSNEIMDYWARFAATGDPNGGVAVQWLPYDAGENILLLDDTIANLPGGYRNTQCDFLSTLPWQ
ncbi:MAG TPA: carboxylesterase family protein [Candidatus Acidoferrum sp.]|nr:carboxylesterase family protein [Candidatus Acidoferrum sp.]